LQALKTDLLSWPGKARMLAEPFTRGAGDESVEAFFVRKFGREAYDAFLGPLYGGLYASDPARMRTRHGLALTLQEFGVEGSLLLAALGRGLRARKAVPTVSFEGGLGVFPRALAAAAGDSLRLGEGVQRLEREGHGWVLGSSRGGVFRAERVVLALPASSAAVALAVAEPEAARLLGSLNYNPLAVVHLQASCDLRGFGYQVAFGEALETRGVTWNASMFGRDGVYTAYLGGMRNPRLVDQEDEWIGDLARDEFRVATGCDCRVLMVSRTAVPAWDESWDALAKLSLPESIAVCAAWSARPGIPGRLAQARALATRLKADANRGGAF
jgi:oxygen-dependent protoporphyrinogen oxidase